MNKKIEQVAFWFADGNERVVTLNNRFAAMGDLFKILISKYYFKKDLEFININFRTEQTYNLFPAAKKNYCHFFNGHLSYDDVFELDEFYTLTISIQDLLIWDRVILILKECALGLENNDLIETMNEINKSRHKLV